MSRIYWDTMLFVYWLEDNPAFAPRVEQIWKRMAERGDTLCTSVFTVGEVLAGLYKRSASEQIDQIREFFRSPQVEILPYDVDTADRYAQIRGTIPVTAPDTIHLARAANAGVDLFLTNDRRLQGLVITGIQFIAGMDVNLF